MDDTLGSIKTQEEEALSENINSMDDQINKGGHQRKQFTIFGLCLATGGVRYPQHLDILEIHTNRPVRIFSNTKGRENE